MARCVAAAFVLAVAFPAAAGAKDVFPRQVTAHSGTTRGVLRYFPFPQDYGHPRPRLTIMRNDRQRFFEVVQPNPRDYGGRRGRVIPSGAPLAVRDLDGDGEPEVLLELYWGGNRCCLWSRVYRFDRATQRYVGANHWWGNVQDDYHLRDLDRDGRPEVVSADGRFQGISDFYSYVDPIQIWSYDHGRFRDVTRRFPDEIAGDSRKWWAMYLEERKQRSEWVREPLAAWVGDQYLLGNAKQGDRVLALALRTGGLTLPSSYSAISPRAYVSRLRAFLRKAGYA